MPPLGKSWWPCTHWDLKSKRRVWRAVGRQCMPWEERIASTGPLLCSSCLGHEAGTIFQCPKCMFEYQVDAVDYGERGIAITITLWRILNLCVRINWDERYKKQLRLRGWWQRRLLSNGFVIRGIFEGQGIKFGAEDYSTPLSREMLLRKICPKRGRVKKTHVVDFDK